MCGGGGKHPSSCPSPPTRPPLCSPGGALDASPAGLRSLRTWVLDREHLADVRCTLLALIDELHCTGPLLAHLREETQQDQQAAAAAVDTAAPVVALEAAAEPAVAADKEEAPADGPPAARRTAAETLSALQGSVEGALRNVLTSLAVPLLCADPGQASEVTALTVFALKYYYRIYQEGFADVFKLLAVRTSAYRGSYLPFYCALSGQSCSPFGHCNCPATLPLHCYCYCLP